MATMLELGARYGGLAFTCERDFEVVGAWVRSTPEPAWQVRFADHCHRFAFHADRLRWLVPEIVGLTVADQLVALPDLEPLEPLDPPATTADRVAALTAHWRRLASAYAALLASLNLVSDGAAARWLGLLRTDAEEALAGLARP
jgi:hypothetical protein